MKGHLFSVRVQFKGGGVDPRIWGLGPQGSTFGHGARGAAGSRLLSCFGFLLQGFRDQRAFTLNPVECLTLQPFWAENNDVLKN